MKTKPRKKTRELAKFAEHARQRRENAQRISSGAERFKVCAGCLSIFYKPARVCSFCKGYRWYESVDAVRLIAGITEQTALPFTAAVAPRLSPADDDESKAEQEPTPVADQSTN